MKETPTMNKITIIERPYEAEDNDWNLAERDLIKYYCDRHGEEINTFEIYKYSVIAYTVSGRKFLAQRTFMGAPIKKISTYLYLNEEVNGKQKRIKKSEY